MPNLGNWAILSAVGLLLALAVTVAAVVFMGRPGSDPGGEPVSRGRLVAEPDSPAVLTARIAESGAATLTLRVAGYTPPGEGSVQAVVKVKDPASGGLREIGRFTVFPNQPFKAPDADGALRFSFPIDEATGSAGPNGEFEVTVELVPVGNGAMTGARLEFIDAITEAA